MAATSEAQVAPVQPVSNPVLREYLEQLEDIRRDARELAVGLTREQLNWRPNERRWSVGQCLDHLTRTLELYLVPMQRMLGESRARKNRGERGFRDGLMAKWLIRTMEPPPSVRIRSPGRIQPADRLDPEAVLASFDAAHDRLAELLRAADGVSLSHARMASPLFRPMRMTLRQAFEVNLAHARRHLWQGRQIRGEAAFPGGRM